MNSRLVKIQDGSEWIAELSWIEGTSKSQLIRQAKSNGNTCGVLRKIRGQKYYQIGVGGDDILNWPSLPALLADKSLRDKQAFIIVLPLIDDGFWIIVCAGGLVVPDGDIVVNDIESGKKLIEDHLQVLDAKIYAPSDWFGEAENVDLAGFLDLSKNKDVLKSAKTIPLSKMMPEKIWIISGIIVVIAIGGSWFIYNQFITPKQDVKKVDVAAIKHRLDRLADDRLRKWLATPGVKDIFTAGLQQIKPAGRRQMGWEMISAGFLPQRTEVMWRQTIPGATYDAFVNKLSRLYDGKPITIKPNDTLSSATWVMTFSNPLPSVFDPASTKIPNIPEKGQGKSWLYRSLQRYHVTDIGVNVDRIRKPIIEAKDIQPKIPYRSPYSKIAFTLTHRGKYPLFTLRKALSFLSDLTVFRVKRIEVGFRDSSIDTWTIMGEFYEKD